MHIIAKFLLPAALLLLGGCNKISDLSYQKGVLSLQVNKKHLQISGRPLYRHTDNFGNLYLTREMLKLDNGNLVAYERARTDQLYEFNLPPLQTIRIVFDARDIRVVYLKSSFYLLQLILQNGSVLNMALEQFDDQRLTLVYGMPTSQMKKLFKELNPQVAVPPMMENAVTIPPGSHLFLSHWSVPMVQLTPLITPLRYNSGFL